jgi:hypothetical protein
MAKSKTQLLGTVIKVHDSGICDTDKGFSVSGKYEIGSVLVLENATRKVSVKPKKTDASGNNDGETLDLGSDE